MHSNNFNSILTGTIIDRFGNSLYSKYFDSRQSCSFFCHAEEKELLDCFITDEYFLDHSLFNQYRDQPEFQRFFGAFYLSTLDLLIKLYILRNLLEITKSHGVIIFSIWTPFFKDNYHSKFITRRNMQMEAFLSLSREQIISQNQRTKTNKL